MSNQNVVFEENFDWDRLLSVIKNNIDDLSFDSWIRQLRFHKVESNILFLYAPSVFIKNWVMTNFKEVFIQAFVVCYPNIKSLEISVDSFNSDQLLNPLANAQEIFSANIDEDINIANTFEFKLNPEYTFENFVVDKSNEFAYTAAHRVACDNIVNFNPLFIYGGVGLGKTHLMHSIAWEIINKKLNRKFLYLTAEKFAVLYVMALREKNIMSFKEMFRSTDILMIDDFQFIGGKEQTQEEFFHTFNSLISQGKQIILTADKSPLDLDKIEARIVSRLQAGLPVSINSTTYELRLGILESKAKNLNIKIPKDVLDFLAHTITSNVRELEGALKRVISYHRIMNVKIDLNMAMNVLEDVVKFVNKTISIDLIQKKVAEHYSIKLADMSSIKKDKMTSQARHIAMYLAKKLTKSSLPEIGKKFGGRDHTTVIYSVNKIEDKLKNDIYLQSDIKLLINILQKN